jgi:hypothetical protein
LNRFRVAHLLLACLAPFLLPDLATAKTATPKSFVDAKTRDIVGGRKVLVVLASPEIEAGFDAMTMSPAAIVFGYMGHRWGLDKINRERAERATPRVLPLRAALAGYDFNSRFYDELVPVVQSSSWLRGQDYERTASNDPDSLERELNDSNTRQMYVLSGDWYVDHHRQAICVELTATILVRKIPKGQYSEARLRDDYIPYRQSFRSVVYLPDIEKAAADDLIARWAADDARLARRALDVGLQRVRTMFAENIDADEQQAESWRRRGDRKTVERYDMLGWVVARETDGVRFTDARSGALNFIETVKTD